MMVGFLIAVEIEEGTPVPNLVHKLADALTWVEGVGKVEVDFIGQIEMIEEDAEIIEGEVMSSSSMPDLSKDVKES